MRLPSKFSEPTSLKLHIGCGTVHLPGFVNVDIRYQPGVDVVDNAAYLRRWRDVDEIYACHVLEHFGRWEYPQVLRRWHEILKPGGLLRVAVPDFDSVAAHYRARGELRPLLGLLYGGQDYAENFHKAIWNFDLLADDLGAAGFRDVQRYEWRETPFADVDDYSKAYLPHLDRDGRLMSLNVEARA